MTNADLAAYLNRELNLSGSDAVTANVIRQWVEWEVLPRAGGRGRGRARGIEWERSGRDVRRAKRLARWRADGVMREAAVIVHAFVEWGHPDWERVRHDLAKELLRSGGLLRSKVRTDLRFGAFGEVSATRKRAFRTQLGPLDDRLKGTMFELSAELYARGGQIALGSQTSRDKLVNLVTDKLSAIVPEIAGEATGLISILIDAQLGLFADPEETDNAGVIKVGQCTNSDLRLARLLLKFNRKTNSIYSELASVNLFPAELARLLAKLEPEIETGNWLVGRFAAALVTVMQFRQLKAY